LLHLSNKGLSGENLATAGVPVARNS